MPRKRPIDEFCAAYDDAIGCKTEYICDVCCPLQAFMSCLRRGQDTGDAMRESVRDYVRSNMEEATKVKIIEGKLGMTLEQIRDRLMKEGKEVVEKQ